MRILARKTIDTREEMLDLITSMSCGAREAELRPRIALHLSGLVRVPASATSISDNLADCKRVILLIINMLRRNLPVRSYEKTYHLADVEITLESVIS